MEQPRTGRSDYQERFNGIACDYSSATSLRNDTFAIALMSVLAQLEDSKFCLDSMCMCYQEGFQTVPKLVITSHMA